MTSKSDPRGGIQYPPMAFSEQGVTMLSSVLNSDRAVEVNIAIMRAFIRLQEFIASHARLAKKLHEIEQKVEAHDTGIQALFEAIQQLTSELPPAIGFHAQPGTGEAGPEARQTVKEMRAKYRIKSKNKT